MANLKVKDADSADAYLKATGAGSSGDPHIPYHHEAGAATLATGQVATSTTAATLVVARATRRQVVIRNHDAAINVFVGPATVTTSNGYLVPPGQAVTLTSVGLIQVIAASGTPTVSYADEYN